MVTALEAVERYLVPHRIAKLMPSVVLLVPRQCSGDFCRCVLCAHTTMRPSGPSL